jgi:hypothetical protein
MTLQRIQFKDLKGTEGLVFLGCGGDLDEWTNGIKLMLPADCQGIFGEFSLLVSSGGRHDLVLPFLEGKGTPMSLIAWRLRFGDCSWISDYRVNYRDHHHHHHHHHHLHNCVQTNENLDAPAEVQENVAVIDGDKDDDEVEVEVEIEIDEAENKHATRTVTKRTLRPQHSQSPNIPARRPKRRLFVQE